MGDRDTFSRRLRSRRAPRNTLVNRAKAMASNTSAITNHGTTETMKMIDIDTIIMFCNKTSVEVGKRQSAITKIFQGSIVFYSSSSYFRRGLGKRD